MLFQMENVNMSASFDQSSIRRQKSEMLFKDDPNPDIQRDQSISSSLVRERSQNRFIALKVSNKLDVPRVVKANPTAF